MSKLPCGKQMFFADFSPKYFLFWLKNINDIFSLQYNLNKFD